MTIRLYLDDQRIEPEGWLRVTTAENCIWALQEFAGHIEELSLDHDLDEHVDTRKNGYADPPVATGYDVALWLEEKAYFKQWKFVPKVLKCHSANPNGRQRILQAFEAIQKFKEVYDEELSRRLAGKRTDDGLQQHDCRNERRSGSDQG